MAGSVPRAVAALRPGEWSDAADTVFLDYAARFLRRRRLAAQSGHEFLADLPETVSLDDGSALKLEDGRLIEVRAAPEDLVEVRGDGLARLAWHIGNRHTPCEVRSDRLVIRRDHVIEAMLAQLGAQLVPVTGPFRPEGGAYGHGRTLGHDHAPAPGHHEGAHGHLRVHTHVSHRHDDEDGHEGEA